MKRLVVKVRLTKSLEMLLRYNDESVYPLSLIQKVLQYRLVLSLFPNKS